MKKEPRHVKAGRLMGESIIEAVHMMYQMGTAARYYRGLTEALNAEMKKRLLMYNITNGEICPNWKNNQCDAEW